MTGCFMSISSNGDDPVYRVVVGEYKENYVEVLENIREDNIKIDISE